LDDLVPEDRPARLDAEWMQSEWIRERRARRQSLG
jgi:hypothetical protein